jgi:hypothetical protein
MATLPPGFSKRNISWKTIFFSALGTKFMTQLLIMQSVLEFGSGMEVIDASMKDALETPAFSTFFLARFNILFERVGTISILNLNGIGIIL